MGAVKLQVPMDKDVRDALERRARSLGFDSAQAYIRVWAKAEVDGRRLDFDRKAIILSSEANERYARMVAELEAEERSGDVKTFSTTEEFMKSLRA